MQFLFHIIFLFLLFNPCFGQVLIENDVDLLKLNKVSKVEYFVTCNNDYKEDSTIIEIDYYNEVGLLLKREFYDSLKLISTDTFFYGENNVLTRREKFSNDISFINYFGNRYSIHHYAYDINGNNIREGSSLGCGTQMGNWIEKIYNNKNQITKSKSIWSFDIVQITYRYKYLPNGVIKVILDRKKNKKIKYLVQINKDKNRLNNKILEPLTDLNLTLINGENKLRKGDILLTEIKYNEEGLIDLVQEYLNEILIGQKKYIYFYN